MSIYAIADLHLSFSTNKPMDVFGDNWEGHTEKIKNSWLENVKQDDYVILSGDFSWATYLEDAKQDFLYLSTLPGKKILLKGNHDYWWTTLAKMRKFLDENKFSNIDFLYNNSYLIQDKIIVGTRGWNLGDTAEDIKMIQREAIRLEISIQDGIKRYGEDKEIIAFLHYPPLTFYKKEDNEFVRLLKKYNIKRCYYGHLHGKLHDNAVEENIDGIEYKLISADYLDFKLSKI